MTSLARQTPPGARSNREEVLADPHRRVARYCGLVRSATDFRVDRLRGRAIDLLDKWPLPLPFRWGHKTRLIGSLRTSFLTHPNPGLYGSGIISLPMNCNNFEMQSLFIEV